MEVLSDFPLRKEMSIQIKTASIHVRRLGLLVIMALSALPGICASTAAPVIPTPVVLDRVVAVVNNQVILLSELDEERQLAVLDPSQGETAALTPQRALEQLIARALIEQQMRQQSELEEPAQSEVDARLAEIRQNLPACVHENCASEAGWKTFLTAHSLRPERVESYLRYRLEILHFIEDRFRQEIQISPAEIETYYRNTLLPQYAAGDARPTLDKVSPRIQEILLQQHVNILFDNWLDNLRKTGRIEILDPALRPVGTPSVLVDHTTEGEEGKP